MVAENASTGVWLLWRRIRPWHVANVLCVVVLFTGLSGYLLLDPDESRYAEIPREMLERGDWITPTLNYVPYFEKPPLMYWMVAGSMKLFGEDEWAIRVVPAVCGVLGMLVAFWLANITVGRAAARWAPAVLATSLLYFIMARIPVTDMPFSVLLAASLTAWWSSQRTGGRRWGMLAVSGVLLGLAVLTKGPVALVLFLGTLSVYLAWTRQLPRVFVTAGIPVALACVVAAPWFLMVQARNPQFAHYYVVVQHWNRFTGHDFPEHNHPVYYLVPVLIAGCAMWSIFWPVILPGAFRRWRTLPAEGFRPKAFLIVWAAFIFLFFSLSASKLVPYILPIWWPLAVATTAGVHRAFLPEQVRYAVKVSATAAGVSMVALLGALLWYVPHQVRVPAAEVRVPVLILSVAWVVAAAGLCLASRRGSPDTRLALLVASAAVASVGLVPLYQTAAMHCDLAELLPQALRPPDKGENWILAQHRCYDQSFNYYTRSRVVLVDMVTELRLGLHEPDADKWFLEGEAAIDELSSQGPLALATIAERAEQIARDHHLTIWDMNPNRALLFNDEGLKLVRRTARLRGEQ